jgi:hypothetical protein
MADAQDDYGDGQDYSDDESEVQVTGTRRLPKKRLVIDDDEDDEDDEVEEVQRGLINSDLHGLIYTYYLAHPDPKIKVETKEGDVHPRTKEWNNWIPSAEPAAKQRAKPTKPTKATASRKRTPPKSSQRPSPKRSRR